MLQSTILPEFLTIVGVRPAETPKPKMSARDATQSIEQLLMSLEKLSPKLEGREEDIQFLKDMLQTEEFHSIMRIHKEVSSATASPVSPEWPNALSLMNMISYDAESGESDKEKELFTLLSSPHINALISAHDQVANKEYPLQSVADDGDELMGEQALRIVCIEKKSDPLGATVKEVDGNIVISRVLCGGAADRSGMLCPGDVLHEINGRELSGLNVDDVADLMKDLTGTVVLKIKPAMKELRSRRRNELPVHMRAFFSYDPTSDRHHPCKEVGLKFERGSILRIVNQEDPNWWQAIKLGEKSISTGLIPSRTFKERLACYDHHVEQLEQQKQPTKTKHRDYSTIESESFGSTMITYEEMVKVKPQVKRPRPILLIAPRGKPFDMETLRRKLLNENPTKFGSPIAHTSRPRRPDERNGKHYHFVSREEMERAIENNSFVEYVFLDGHYFGTSISSIRNVMNSGLTCLLDLEPQAIKMVRIPELTPFIVYFRPPPANVMKQSWIPNGIIQESGIPGMVQKARYLEKTYGHYFDHAILFRGLNSAYTGVVSVADRLQQDEQWVPASWASHMYNVDD